MKHLKLKKTSLYFESELDCGEFDHSEYISLILGNIGEECFNRNLYSDIEVFHVIVCRNFSDAERAEFNNALIDNIEVDEVTVREVKLPESCDYQFGIKDIVINTMLGSIKVILNVIFMDKYENKN